MNALEKYVEELNGILCKDTKNHIVVLEKYGLYQVALTGKNGKIGFKDKTFGVTNGFNERIITLRNLEECVKYNWLQSVILKYEYVT